tara:strand:+ start:844 stop:1527 length:684 start_codon:yes stop_codon:yes gene_type:complete
MVLSSNSGIPGSDREEYGWYLPECAHPYLRFKEEGYKIDIASVLGGKTTVCPTSVDLKDEDNKKFWECEETRKLIEQSLPLSDCNGKDYDAVFYVGGFGTMWDFPNDENVQRVAREVYEHGGVVSAVCHGPIALANVKLANGDYLVKGMNMTAFTNEEEDQIGVLDLLPNHEGAGKTCEDVLQARGANFLKSSAWHANALSDGRLCTGQNPASAKLVAEKVIQVLSK